MVARRGSSGDVLVLITGASGFVGSHVRRRLQERGIAAVAVGRYRESGEVPTIPESDDARVVHLGWDVRRRGDWDAQAQCLAESVRMLSVLGKHRPHQIISIGSAEEYGCAEGRLAETDASRGPLSAYGWAKTAARAHLESWPDERTAVLWLRPFVVYGPGQTGSMMIPAAVNALRQGKRTDFSDGRQERDFVHVDDLVSAILLGLERCPPGRQALNIGAGEPIAVRTVLEELESLFGVPGVLSIGAIPRRPREPDVQVANAKKAADILGWRVSVPWKSGIRSLLSPEDNKGKATP